MLVVALLLCCPQCRITQAFLMHLGDVIISVAKQKSLLSLQGPSAAKEAERKSLAVKQWCFQHFFSLFTQTFGKEQGSWLSDASTAPMHKLHGTWQLLWHLVYLHVETGRLRSDCIMLSKHFIWRQRSLGSYKGSLTSSLRTFQLSTSNWKKTLDTDISRQMYGRPLYALRQITWRTGRQAGRKGNTKKAQ